MFLDYGEQTTEKELSEDFTIKEWDGTDVKVYEKGIIGQTDFACLCAKYDNNDEYIVSWYSNGQIELYEADSLEYVCHLEDSEEESKKAVWTMVKFKPGVTTDDIIAIDVKGEIRRYSASDKKMVTSITTEEGEENRLFALDYSPDGSTFATAGTDHFVRVYDDATMKLKEVMDPFYTNKAGHTNRIFWVSYNQKDPNMLCSAGWDSTIIIHDIRKKGPVWGLLGAYVCGEALDFYGKDIISGSWRNEKQIELWDIRKEDKVKDIDWDGGNFESQNPVRIFTLTKTHHDSINSIMVAAGGEGDELHIFNQNYSPVVKITDVSRAIFTCDVSRHSDSFLFAGGDGVIRVCKVIIYST